MTVRQAKVPLLVIGYFLYVNAVVLGAIASLPPNERWRATCWTVATLTIQFDADCSKVK